MRIRTPSFPSLLALGLAVQALPAQTPCGPPLLQSVPVPTESVDTRIHDVAALSASDAWAVGTYRVPTAGNSEWFSYTLHWDGTSWQQVAAPSPPVAPGVRMCELWAVAAIAANDVWAAGWKYIAFPNNGHIGPQLFVLRWDGSQWNEMPAPIPYFSYMASSSGSVIKRIHARSATDIDFWGFWSGDEVSPQGQVVWHWDGSTYTREHLPLISSARNVVVDATVAGPGELWAIANTGGGNYRPYLARRTSAGWSMVNPPTQALAYYRLSAVAATAANDLWVAGYEQTFSPPQTLPYVVHWDGSRFSRVPTTGFPSRLIAFAPNDVWAFGTTIEHWDGSAWTVAEPLAGRSNAQFLGASAAGPCTMFAGGTQHLDSGGFYIVPLAAAIGPSGSGEARVRPSCSGVPLRCSLLPSNAPTLGRTFGVGIDDLGRETGIAPATAVTFYLLGAGPAPGWPCGVSLPGLGANGGPADLMLDPTLPFAMTGPQAWQRHGEPARHAIAIPNQGSLLNRRLYTQGVLVDVTSLRAVLTSGVDLRIGR